MAIHSDKAAKNLSINLVALRKTKNMSQQSLARVIGMSRATLALLESGSANPTLEILVKLGQGLKISVDELISSPRSDFKLVRSKDVPKDRRSRNGVELRKLLPEKIPASEIDELTLSPEAILTGSPHIEGTREFFTCLRGTMMIAVLGETHILEKGDVLAFPGDKPHSYKNVGKGQAHGISVVLFTSSL
jgi:transcriptional regulator with XRE-family HTH domain